MTSSPPGQHGSPHHPPYPPPYGAPGGWGPPQGAPWAASRTSHGPPPDSHLAWSVLALFLGCVPLGVVALVRSTRVDRLWMTGQHEEARAASRSARRWAVAGIVLAVPFVVALVLLMAWAETEA